MKKKVEEGSIFGIPLFMFKDDWDLKLKLEDKDNDKVFAFGRVIKDEGGSGVLVEIFNKTGSLNTEINEIVNSSLLFKPLYIFWIGVMKKRWKIIGKTENYDKYKDSNFSDINIIFGIDDNVRVFNYGTNEEIKITEEQEESLDCEYAVTWFPIDLENRIIEEIGGNSTD